MNFEDYLKTEISKPHPRHFDLNGNSARAVVTRGAWGEVLYQYKGFPSYVKYAVSMFDGANTTIGWFIQMPILLLLSPIIPALWGLSSRKRAIKEYREEFEWKNKV